LSYFLLEIGTEELPADFANSARLELKTLSENFLKNNSIGYKKINTYSTPRRLVVIVDDISDKQQDNIKEIKGPPENISYDDKGNPTKALIGFCNKQNISLNEIEKREVKGSIFLFAKIKEDGKKTIELLPNMIDYLIENLSVKRSMRWASFETKFSRPIHWILALMNNNIVDYCLNDIYASNKTNGHRFLGKKNIEISSLEDYFSKLKENKVIVDNEERKEIIIKQLKEEASKIKAKVLIDNDLLEEVNQLVEYPNVIIGEFDKRYLEIPQIVNVTVMKNHQRYFPLFDNDNKLLPYFLTVSNMNLNIKNIKEGNERVIRARLEDAIFYNNEDSKEKLDKKTEYLKNVTYFDELGSIYDKIERIKKIGLFLAKNYFNYTNYSKLERACYICKSDLVTSMVKEFTELQGEIGYYYALRDGEDLEVANSIKEQYLPTSNNNSLPSQKLSQIINIADKVDNITSCFALDKIPTGSKDPYALRRQSLGIIKIAYNYKLNLNMKSIFNYSILLISEKIKIKDNLFDKIKEFFIQRLKNELIENSIRHDIIDAVLFNEELENLYSTQERAIFLNSQLINFSNEIIALSRIIRICKENYDSEIFEELFEKEEEKNLYYSYNDIKDLFEKYYSEHDYLKCMEALSKITDRINLFFDNVMVMVDNENVKKNRLSLLSKIKKMADKICNMDKLII